MDKRPEVENDDDTVQAAKTKELFRALKASEGWHKLQDIVKARAAAIQQSILAYPLDEAGLSPYKQEFRKGHALGLLEVALILEQELNVAEEFLALEEDEDQDA